MKQGGGLTGIDSVMKGLNNALKKYEKASLPALIKGVIVIRRDMEKTSPKTPVDTGNLRASFFTVTSKGLSEGSSGGFKGTNASVMKSNHSAVVGAVAAEAVQHKNPYVLFGFSANYAWIIHEDQEANFKRPGSGPGFLTAALLRNKGKLLTIIANDLNSSK